MPFGRTATSRTRSWGTFLLEAPARASPSSDIPFLLVSMTTLAHVPKGDTFFGTASPQPTLKNGFVLPNTLEEALSALAVECAADD